MPNNLPDESKRLKKAMTELVALNQIANAVNALMSVEEITQVIIDRCLKKTEASQGAVFLLDEKDKEADKFKTFIREFSPTEDKIPFHVNESLTGWIIKNKTMFVTNDPDNDDRFKWMHLSDMGINSILAAPLFAGKGLIGSIILFNKKGEGFTEEDKRFLGIVGSQTAKVIENARLREQEQQLIAIREEIKVARTIQQRLLPQTSLDLKGCEALGMNYPARDVGGDYFDIVKLSDDKVFLSLGDVSGKGVPAAILMANAQAVLRSQLFEITEVPLSKLARSLNHLICQFTGPEQFITALFGLYDCSKKTLNYINAGHEPPLIVRSDGRIETESQSDLVLGVMEDIPFNENSVTLNHGDMFIVFTDGITEAFNENDEQFGIVKLKNILKNLTSESADKVGKAVLEAIQTHRGAGPQTDDITMLILKAN